MSDEHLLKVSSDPVEAINEVALDELNRLNQKVVRLENKNAALERQVTQMQESLASLWRAYNSHPHHQ